MKKISLDQLMKGSRTGTQPEQYAYILKSLYTKELESGGFQLNETLLNLIERFATQILKMSIYRIDDGKVISLESVPDGIGKVRTICCSNVLFRLMVSQIGDKENMSAGSENGQLARQILDEYYHGFQERNPNLYVFSSHIHMDEATPHLHIDFVPFTTGSKRGLDTSQEYQLPEQQGSCLQSNIKIKWQSLWCKS